MSVKKLLNAPETCVDEGLYGVWRSYPSLALHSAERTLFHTVANDKRRFAVLSGGGSGHEPFPSGYVGKGMLTASVSGSTFASPTKGQILQAIRKLSESHEGVFLVIPNYTGDRLNFGLALEAANKQGIKVQSTIVGEDIAVTAYGAESKSGRRGMCGLIVVLKLAGYLSEEGKSLNEMKKLTEIVSENMGSIGVSLEACSLPGSGPLFNLNADEMELGVGVHGEAGVRKMKLKSAKETVAILLEPLIKCLKLKENDEVVALVNNLGALSQMEQWIVAGELDKQISKKNIKICRMYAGSLFTSLNMAGIQICLLRLDPEVKDLLLQALDDPTTAPSWPGSPLSVGTSKPNFSTVMRCSHEEMLCGVEPLTGLQTKIVEECLMQGSKLVIENEEKLNFLDSGCGDGDCGTTIARLANEILVGLTEKRLDLSRPGLLLTQLCDLAESSMGGTMGAIYGLFLTGASTEFSVNSSVDAELWGKAWSSGIGLIKKYSLARIGDRTLMDVLEPGCDTFQKCLQKYGPESGKKAFAAAVESAKEGCSATRHMKAAIGRASYVESAQLKDVDAGAFGVLLWLTAFSRIIADTP